MRTKMFFMCMMLFGALMSELPIWGEYTYKMDASMLPVGARAGLSVSPSGLKRGAFVGGAWGPANYLWDFDYSPDGKFLVMAAHQINIMLEGIALFNVENLDKLPALTAVYELVRSVTFSPDGRTIAAGKLDGTVALIDMATLSVVDVVDVGHSAVSHRFRNTSNIPIAWLSPDRSTLALERSAHIQTSVLHWSDVRGSSTQTIKRQQETNDYFPFILSVGFDSSATTLASVNQDGMIHLWDIGNGEHLQKFTHYFHYSQPVAKGDWFCEDRIIYEVNVGADHGGREYWRSDGPDDPDPPGPDRRILIASNDHGYHPRYLGNGELDEELYKIIHLYETTYKFEPDEGSRCPHVWPGGWIEEPHGLKHRFRGHKDTIWNVAFGTDGREIASASFDDTIRVWDVETGSQKTEFASHTLRFSNIAFGRDGEVLAVGNLDGTILLRVDGKWWRRFKAHAGPVTSLAFHPQWEPYIAHIGNGKSVEVPVIPTLASAGTDGTVRFWHLQMDTERVRPRTAPWVFYTKPLGSKENFKRVSSRVGPLIDVGDIVTSVAFSPDGHTFAFGSWKGVKVLKLWTVVQGSQPIGYSKPVMSVAFSPDSNTLAAGCLDGTIRLGNVGPAGRTGTLEGHKARVFKVVFSSDGRTLASGSDDGTVLLWNHEPALSSDNEFPLPSTTFQPEDVNKDGKVNIQDLVFVSQSIGAIGENPADVNQDGFVNIQDLILIAAAIRKT